MFLILWSIVFCGTHNIALRGKENTWGNVNDLYQFCVKAGNERFLATLWEMLSRILILLLSQQNKLIELCGYTIHGKILGERLTNSRLILNLARSSFWYFWHRPVRSKTDLPSILHRPFRQKRCIMGNQDRLRSSIIVNK